MGINLPHSLDIVSVTLENTGFEYTHPITNDTEFTSPPNGTYHTRYISGVGGQLGRYYLRLATNDVSGRSILNSVETGRANIHIRTSLFGDLIDLNTQMFIEKSDKYVDIYVNESGIIRSFNEPIVISFSKLGSQTIPVNTLTLIDNMECLVAPIHVSLDLKYEERYTVIGNYEFEDGIDNIYLLKVEGKQSGIRDGLLGVKIERIQIYSKLAYITAQAYPTAYTTIPTVYDKFSYTDSLGMARDISLPRIISTGG